jgi:KDO2-lipid IV(A) lauroyltransferase
MRERILRGVTSAVTGFFGSMSPQTIARWGTFLGDLGYILFWRQRKIGLYNLRLAFGDTISEDERKWIVRDVFRNLGQTAIEFAQIPSLTYEKAAALIAPEHRERLDECLERGKGVVLVGSHFGNWELMAAAGALAGYPISAVAKPMKIWDEVVREIRESSGLKIIIRDRSAFTIVKRLKRNEIVGILADQNTRKQMVFVDFFGVKAAAAVGPALLALKTKAALAPVFMVRSGVGRHRLVLEEPIEVNPTGDIEVDALALTQKYAAVLETYVRRYPSQWLWLHRRWRTRPPGEPELY